MSIPSDSAAPFILLNFDNSTIWYPAVDAALDYARAIGFPHAVDWIGGPIAEEVDDSGCLAIIGAFWRPERMGSLRRALAQRRFPIINLSNHSGPLPGMGNMLSDDVAVGALAADHFLARRYSSFLVVALPEDRHAQERVQGFRERLRPLGYPVREFRERPSVSAGIHTPHSARVSAAAALRPFLQNLPPDTGVFAASDWLAQIVQTCLFHYFPDRLHTTGILGVDNTRPESYSGQVPEISSIVPAFGEMARQAFAWVLAHPGEVDACTRLIRRFPPVRVVERASTAGPSCADPVTAQLLRWAWSELRRGQRVSVKDLARHQGMSRRTIMRRFSQHLHLAPSDYLEQLRLDYARELLRGTRLPITEISHRCGYAKMDVLSRAIRRAEGCPPRAYRARFQQKQVAAAG